MEEITIQSLLARDEERLRGKLRAGHSIDKSAAQSVRLLDEELSALLLRYNAACVGDRLRQTAADAVTATARDSLGLLGAAEAELQKGERRIRLGAPTLLLLSAALFALGLLLVGRWSFAPWLGGLAGLLCAFLSGRLWLRESKAAALCVWEPEALWLALQRMCETMDRKIAETLEVASQGSAEGQKGAASSSPLGKEELELFGALLEGLCSENADYALRQLRRLRPYLDAKGLELQDYDGTNAELFELLPAKKGRATLRPALVFDGRLLLAGRATDAAN